MAAGSQSCPCRPLLLVGRLAHRALARSRMWRGLRSSALTFAATHTSLASTAWPSSPDQTTPSPDAWPADPPGQAPPLLPMAASDSAMVVFPQPGAPAKIVSMAAGSKPGHSQRTGSRVTASPQIMGTTGAAASTAGAAATAAAQAAPSDCRVAPRESAADVMLAAGRLRV